MDDTDDMKHKNGRYHPEVEQGLRQFLKLETGLGNSRSFRQASCWCKCGRLKSQEHGDLCAKCAKAEVP